MATVQISIPVDRTEAIRAGKTQFGDVVVSLTEADLATFTEIERATLAGCSLSNGILTLYSPITQQRHLNELPKIAEATPETVRQTLVALDTVARAFAAAAQKKHDEELEENIAHALAAPDSKWLVDHMGYTSDCWTVVLPGSYIYSKREEAEKDPRLADRLARLQAEAHRLTTEARGQRKKREEEALTRKAAEQAEKTRKAAARSAQLARWVKEHGTENQRKRHARGLLPEGEILASIRTHIFAPLADWPLYEKITDREVWEAYEIDSYEEPETTYDSWAAEELTADEFDRLEEAERLIPGCKAEAFVHRGRLERTSEDQDEECQVLRKSLKVTVTDGELTLGRRFAL